MCRPDAIWIVLPTELRQQTRQAPSWPPASRKEGKLTQALADAGDLTGILGKRYIQQSRKERCSLSGRRPEARLRKE